jgi:glutaconate CoA-transferase subunit A
MISALEAGARGIPFMPVRSGLGSDLLRVNSNIQEFVSPFEGEKLIAVKAIRPDVALIHVNSADPTGYGQILGDRFLDPLCAQAAKKTIMSAEKIVDAQTIENSFADTAILKLWTSKVVEAPGGAGFTSCYPDYPADFGRLKEYLGHARSAETFNAYVEKSAAGQEKS